MVLIINVTEIGAPFRFTELGFTDALTPGGRIFPMLSVTGLAMLEAGVRVTGVVAVCPYVTLIALLLDRLKSGIFTVIRSPDVDDPA